GGNLVVTGTLTYNGGSANQVVATHVPTAHAFSSWGSGAANSNVSASTIYINPATSPGDGNLIGAAVGGSVRFIVDQEGDIYGNNLVLTGTTSTGNTTIVGSLTVEGSTTLGDASADTITLNAATVTAANDTNFVLSGGINGLSFDTTTLSIDATNDRVGIGTATPLARGKLTIEGGDNDGITISNSTIADASKRFGINNEGATLRFLPLNASGTETAEGVHIDRDGDLGIGTTPAVGSALDINGVTTFRGNIIADVDNSYDIGASGATRPRTGYFGTSVVTPLVSVAAASALTITANNASTWSTSNGLLTITGDDGVTLNATSTAGITGNVPDELTNAIDIQQGSDNYINVSTVGAGAMAFGNAVTNPSFGFLGTGLITVAGAGAETASLTLTTGTVTLTDGDLTVSSGEIAATSDDATGTAFSFTGVSTTGTVLGLTANALSSGSATNITSSNNSAANTAWSANQLNVTNAQATTAVSSGSIAGLDLQFTQNASVAGNTETAGRIALKQNDASPLDATVTSILSLENNDTVTGNQIVATDGLKVTAGTSSNITNGINLSGTFATNYITSTNFAVTNAGAITGVGVNSGTGLIQGTGGITVTGTGNINATGTAATNIGNSTGALTLASGGTSAWTNTSGNLTIQTATSGTMAVDSAGILNLGTTNQTALTLGRVGATTAISGSTITAGSSTTTAITLGNVTTNPTLALLGTGLTTFGGALTVTGHTTFEGVTSTGATGTGKLVYDGTPTLITPALGVATGTSLATSAQNIFTATGGTAPLILRSATSTDDDIRILPFTTGAGRFAGIITTADLTADRTYTFPDVTGNVALDTGGATTGNVLLETEIDTSSELLALMDDETGTGLLVFGTSPTFTTSALIGNGAYVGQAAGVQVLFDDTANELEISGGFVGIGTTGPTAHLQIDGNISATAWTTDGIAFDSNAATYTDISTAGAGTVAVRTANSFGAPTFASTNAITVTDAFTLYVPKPIAGANTTITRANSAYFEGNVGIGTTNPATSLSVLAVTPLFAGHALAVGTGGVY
ncbi:MAG: hypothetical protein AAB933_00050, partial [Patescibacteria group bacterium]